MAETIKINKTTMSFNKIWYVDGINGSDTTGNGSIELPYKTLSKAGTASAYTDCIYLISNTADVAGYMAVNARAIIGNKKQTLAIPVPQAGKILSIYNTVFAGNPNNTHYYINKTILTLEFYNCILKYPTWTMDPNSTKIAVGIGFRNGGTSTLNITYKNCVFSVSLNHRIGSAYDNELYMTTNAKMINCIYNGSLSVPSTDKMDTKIVIPTTTYSINTTSLDSNYNITITGWNKTGDPTILNPDSSRSSIGVYGGPYAWGAWPERRYLIRDNDKLKKYVESKWEDVGSYPADVTEEKFMSSTMALTSLTDEVLSQLGSPELLYWTDETATSPKAKLTIVPKPKLLLMNQDIDLSDISNLDSITLTSTTSGNSKVGVIVSNDGGASWTGVNLAAIDTRDLTNVSAKCLSSSALSAITSELWNYLIRDSKKLRFGFYLEKSASTNAASIEELTIQADYPAPPEQRDVSWRILVNGIEKVPFNTAQNIRLVEASIDTPNLTVGDNVIKIEVESPAGDFGEAVVHVYKEQQFRTSAERTMRSIDGGFIQDNIDFLEMAKPRNKKRLNSSKRALNLAEVQLDKFINTISIN